MWIMCGYHSWCIWLTTCMDSQVIRWWQVLVALVSSDDKSVVQKPAVSGTHYCICWQTRTGQRWRAAKPEVGEKKGRWFGLEWKEGDCLVVLYTVQNVTVIMQWWYAWFHKRTGTILYLPSLCPISPVIGEHLLPPPCHLPPLTHPHSHQVL